MRQQVWSRMRNAEKSTATLKAMEARRLVVYTPSPETRSAADSIQTRLRLTSPAEG